MADEPTITQCIALLKEGDRAAADRLWDAYVHRLVALARRKMGATARPAADEEDVALSAFDSFYRRAELGQFARLSDRNDLWQILVVITERKAVNLMRHDGRQRRGEGRVRSLADAAEVLDPGPDPEFAAMVADECARLLDLLRDETLRRVAVLKLEGHTNREIAERIGCIEQTVERKLRSIRRLWTERRPA